MKNTKAKSKQEKKIAASERGGLKWWIISQDRIALTLWQKEKKT